tara:strand:+ start:8289 stop:10577 length:2289 start_codon:yes stop_codon:yes gene_type:complete
MDKKAQRIHKLFDSSDTASRNQWEYINQKGFDFANDNQLSEAERQTLQEQGMPDFTINRIIPVVEMLNYYATANQPRWQAIGAEGSDIDVATVFSDIADYTWNISDGPSIYANAINDAITKSIGYLLVTVDRDRDQGMGEVVIKQPDPFDLYVDPKSRDVLFRDASFIMIRKVMPRNQLKEMFPKDARKVNKAASINNSVYSHSEKSVGTYRKDFTPKDITDSESVDPKTGDHDDLLELFEVYEKKKKEFINIFYRQTPEPEQIKEIEQRVQIELEKLKAELEVQNKETVLKMQQAVEAGEMIPERLALEAQKLEEQTQMQLQQAAQSMMAQMQKEVSKIGNQIVPKDQFKTVEAALMSAKSEIVDVVEFFDPVIQITCVVGDKTLYEYEMPYTIKDYPIIPFHYKWTGTPFPISAVSPLIGKQREINKSHQLMVHNASLGSSLRWMHEEGSIDTNHWEKYASSPGALLPIRPGAIAPTPVQPAPLSNAFFTTVQEGKGDMEYLAGIYSSMQGDTQQQHETFRGMLAMDEYGTRRIKQWMTNCIEPALRQVGRLVMHFTQGIYQTHKVFRIVQPSSIQEERKTEINVPIYNDLGEAIGKYNDYSVAKFDVRIIAGSTLPINRWAYLAELKELMGLGVVDDIAVLAETDIRNKEKIAERKSMYSQMQGQIQNMEEAIKDKEGTIETLERQLVQAGIKQKVMQAEVEISKKKHETKSKIDATHMDTQAKAKFLQSSMQGAADLKKKELDLETKNIIKNLQMKEK